MYFWLLLILSLKFSNDVSSILLLLYCKPLILWRGIYCWLASTHGVHTMKRPSILMCRKLSNNYLYQHVGAWIVFLRGWGVNVVVSSASQSNSCILMSTVLAAIMTWQSLIFEWWERRHHYSIRRSSFSSDHGFIILVPYPSQARCYDIGHHRQRNQWYVSLCPSMALNPDIHWT